MGQGWQTNKAVLFKFGSRKNRAGGKWEVGPVSTNKREIRRGGEVANGKPGIRINFLNSTNKDTDKASPGPESTIPSLSPPQKCKSKSGIRCYMHCKSAGCVAHTHTPIISCGLHLNKSAFIKQFCAHSRLHTVLNFLQKGFWISNRGSNFDEF